MNRILVRTLSAFAALFLLFFAYYFFNTNGIYYTGVAIVLLGCVEYYKMTVQPLFRSRWFFLLYLILCLTILISPKVNAPIELLVATDLTLLTTIFLWLTRGQTDIKKLLQIIGFLSLGLLYTVLMPYFALTTLTASLTAFFGLLVIVFSSDICAFFGGLTFGKKPFMPVLSPKKTIEGSLTGCFGAALFSFLFFNYFPLVGIPTYYWIIFAPVVAFVAQTGDLFESLLKRCAGVKDSGRIMPGHGGVLDRLDGVYFAAPLYWFFILFFTS